MPVRELKWLPNPERGTQVSVGFDGSDSDDFTVIRCRTRSGRLFTPRYGPVKRPTIWNPAEWGGQIPRHEVAVALDEIHDRWDVSRGYYDPPGWRTEIGEWAQKYGEKRVIEWPTYRVKFMHEELERFLVDLKEGRIKDDGCPITRVHMANAIKVAQNGQRYILGKPGGEQHRKIDAAMTSVLAHAAACDAEAGGWPEKSDTTVICFGASKGRSTATARSERRRGRGGSVFG
ncbi:terminase [Prescottella equi]|uniref:terminase n=1 Tax=Rhodococcus hoagii TaxID=43767 RepID=UPI00191C8E82|nr:terminase [Prescottella equi]